MASSSHLRFCFGVRLQAEVGFGGTGYNISLLERGLARQLKVQAPEARGKGFESSSTDTSMAINEKGRISADRKATGGSPPMFGCIRAPNSHLCCEHGRQVVDRQRLRAELTGLHKLGPKPFVTG